MPTVQLTELITRAALAADMHDNFATNAWVYWANVEDKALRVRLAQCSFPTEFAEVTIAANPNTLDYNLNEPLAIVSVNYLRADGSLKKLFHIPMADRRWKTPLDFGEPTHFSCYTHQNVPNIIILNFYPKFSSGSVIVDTVPLPQKLSLTPAAGESSSVSLPLGFEERIVLGMAQRALAKEETINPALERQIAKADEHIDNACFRRLIGENATVRETRKAEGQDTWLYF